MALRCQLPVSGTHDVYGTTQQRPVAGSRSLIGSLPLFDSEARTKSKVTCIMKTPEKRTRRKVKVAKRKLVTSSECYVNWNFLRALSTNGTMVVVIGDRKSAVTRGRCYAAICNVNFP